MSPMRRSATTTCHPIAAPLLLLAGLFAASGPALADPCVDAPFAGCTTYPGSYQIKYSIVSPVALTNIVDMFGDSFPHLRDQGDFPANGQVSLPAGGGTIDAGIWFGEDQHYLLAITNDGVADHLVVMMSSSAAAIASGLPA